MKKRIITVIVAAAALLTLTASPAAAAPTFSSARGVLVRHDDGYIITGRLRDADSQVVGTIHGTLVEGTTGFNSCPDFYFNCMTMTGEVNPFLPPTCNLLGGEVTLNFQGVIYDAQVSVDRPLAGRIDSALCKKSDDPATYRLLLFLWSFSHVTPGDLPDVFDFFSRSVQQISPNVWRWSS